MWSVLQPYAQRTDADEAGPMRRRQAGTSFVADQMVERHCDLARHLAARVDAAPDLERLAEVPLNVVCFRYRPAGLSEPELNDITRRLGDALLHDGRVFAGTTVYGGRTAFRPAISNWRTTAADVDLLVDVIRELASRAE
jgi:glutamate/tyrosine decarboxylase-like PLP-dependent enzyme